MLFSPAYIYIYHRSEKETFDRELTKVDPSSIVLSSGRAAAKVARVEFFSTIRGERRFDGRVLRGAG